MLCSGRFTVRKDLVPIVQEAGWAPGPVRTGAENLTPTRIQSLDHPACSESLHQLSVCASVYCLCPIHFKSSTYYVVFIIFGVNVTTEGHPNLLNKNFCNCDVCMKLWCDQYQHHLV
jgi:hypothetical protein